MQWEEILHLNSGGFIIPGNPVRAKLFRWHHLVADFLGSVSNMDNEGHASEEAFPFFFLDEFPNVRNQLRAVMFV